MKFGILFLLPVSMTVALAGAVEPDDSNAQPCKVTTAAGSRPCTAKDEAALIAKQHRALEMYQPGPSGKPYSMEEQGRALRRLLLGPEAQNAATQHNNNSATPAADRLQRLLSDAAGGQSPVDKPRAPK